MPPLDSESNVVALRFSHDTIPGTNLCTDFFRESLKKEAA